MRRRPYRIAQSARASIEEELNRMLDMGIVRPSISLYATPIIVLKKADGTLRFCADYKALNQVTEFDLFPVPVLMRY